MALSSTQPVDRPLPRRALRLGLDLVALLLQRALDEIACLGGGLVEAISEVTTGREAQGRFFFSATAELVEQYGFTRGRRVGKHAWIVSRAVEPVEPLGT